MSLTSHDILEALNEKYAKYVTFKELRCGTGFGKRSEQRIDLWAIDPYPSHHLARIAFEVKVDRQDYKRELIDPLKRRGALLLSNMFYFVTPPGLISAHEIPIECGLMEVSKANDRNTRPEGSNWTTCGHSNYWSRVVVDAPVRESILPTWKFVASLARRIAKAEQFNESIDPVGQPVCG